PPPPPYPPSLHDALPIYRPLGVASPLEEREDALAHGELADAGAHRAHDAGHLVAGAEGQGRLRLILALHDEDVGEVAPDRAHVEDRKSTRLNSSHVAISY